MASLETGKSPPRRGGILVVGSPTKRRPMVKTVQWDDSQTRVLLFSSQSNKDETDSSSSVEQSVALWPVKPVSDLKEPVKSVWKSEGPEDADRGSIGDGQRQDIYVNWRLIFKQPPQYTY